MGFDAVVRSGVALADKLTSRLQAVVSHERWMSQDAYGVVTYARAIDRPAIVEKTQKRIVTALGQELTARAKITFLAPLADLKGQGQTIATRQHPTDARDRLTLPDGTTGPILLTEGLVDPSTERPYFEIVWVG